MAITGLVLGILGLCFFPLSIVALILGIVAISQIGNPQRRLTGHGMATTAIVLGVVGVVLIPITALLVGILLPALGAARRAAQQMKNTTQIRAMNNAMASHSGQNSGYFFGLDSNGNPIDLTVEYRLKALIDNNYMTSDYLISPAETKTPWQSGAFTTDNYSFSLLDISEDNDRRREWESTGSAYAITISDRNTGISNASQDVESVHTGYPGEWKGSVGFNDGHASFENTHEQDTQYGNGPNHPYDNIFEDAGTGDDAVMIYSGE